MEPQQDPQPPTRLVVVECPVPDSLIGRVPVLLPEPADSEVGWTTTDDNEAW